MSIMRVRQQDGTTVDIPLGKGGHSGADGKSAYEIAVDNGFEGTEAEWLESLKGKDGADGKDATDGVKSVNGIPPDESGNVLVDVGGGSAVETVIEITLTEAVTEVKCSFTAEERKKINSAKKVAISCVASGAFTGVTFGIFRTNWNSYINKIADNQSLNTSARYIMRSIYDLEFSPIFTRHMFICAYGLNTVTAKYETVHLEGELIGGGDTIRLVTTGETPFPIGTIVKVEVVS